MSKSGRAVFVGQAWEKMKLAERTDTKMKIVGWLLIVLGLCAPIVTTELVGADGASAAYTAGSRFAMPIIAIVIAFVLARGMAKERRGLAWVVGGAIMLAAGLWSSFGIN